MKNKKKAQQRASFVAPTPLPPYIVAVSLVVTVIHRKSAPSPIIPKPPAAPISTLQTLRFPTLVAHVFMGVCLAFELSACAGKHLDSSASAPPNALAHVSNEEASSQKFLPMEGTSAVLLSPHRLLVTGGVLQDNRVVPFSVLRHLELDPHSDHCHKWTRPTLLRPPSQRANGPNKSRRFESAIPVCRMEQTLTMVPDTCKLYLIGGMKVGPKDGGSGCSTIFAFDFNAKTWDSVEPANPTSRVKEQRQQQLGPRFAHSATYVAITPKCSSSRQKARAKPAPFIYVYGGFTHMDDHIAVSDVHVFNVKMCKWTIATPASSKVEPPALAYHAACLTPCGKYIAIHGGNNSDFYDNRCMSDEMFLFDVQDHKWLQPDLHPNSDQPPRARRQHSLVQGVGRHEGSLVLYGGYVVNGTYSKEMFLCKILAPEHRAQPLQLLWEEITVRTTVAHPLPDDSQNLPQKMLLEKDAAISGGCLVALPHMAKYIMIGGRTGYGMRKAPLMLCPAESDEIALSQSMEIAQRLKMLKRTGRRLSPVAPKAVNVPVPKSPDSLPESQNTVNENCGIPAAIEHDDQQSLGQSLSPAEGTPETPRLSSVQHASSEKSPISTTGVRGRANITSLGSSRLRKRKPRSRTLEQNPKPQKPFSLEVEVASHAVHPAAHAKDRETEIDPLREADVLLLKSRRAGTRTAEVNAERASPPLKKRCLRSDTKRIEEKQVEEEHLIMSPAPLVDDPRKEGDGANVHDDVLELSMSCRSEFIAPSALKRAGRNNPTKVTKGRGRISAIRMKQAELDASMKKNEEHEETIRRIESEMKKLGGDNDVLKVKNRQLKVDNMGLNHQVERLLQEVQSLRNKLCAHDASDTGFVSTPALIPAEDGSMTGHEGGSIEVEDGQPPSPSASKRRRSDEIRTLESKADGLQEENAAIYSEREAILQELRESIAERREVETELNRTRNLLEQSRVECGKERARANECDRAWREAVNSGEGMHTKLESADGDILLLKSKNETLNLNLMEEKNKVRELTRERAAREQEVGKLRAELAEEQKKFGDHGGKQRLLLGDLEAEKVRCEELNKLVDQNTEKVRMMEERHAEVVAERDALHSELNNKVREHEAALQVTDKDKMSMDHLRRELCDRGIERRRMMRELDSRTKECAKLKAKLVRVQLSCKSIWPSIARIAKQFEETVRECDAADANDGAVLSSEVVTGEEAGENMGNGTAAPANCEGGRGAQDAAQNGGMEDGEARDGPQDGSRRRRRIACSAREIGESDEAEEEVDDDEP
ncbi:unnamed protein product [Agarophyton chilense]